MTYIENNSHYSCNVTIIHNSCDGEWKTSDLGSGRSINIDTFHMCSGGYAGITVKVEYSDGLAIQGPAHDDASVFIADNEIRPFKVSSLP